MCTCTCTCTCMYKHVYCNMRDVYDMPYSNPDFQKKWTPDKPDTDNYKIWGIINVSSIQCILERLFYLFWWPLESKLAVKEPVYFGGGRWCKSCHLDWSMIRWVSTMYSLTSWQKTTESVVLRENPGGKSELWPIIHFKHVEKLSIPLWNKGNRYIIIIIYNIYIYTFLNNHWVLQLPTVEVLWIISPRFRYLPSVATEWGAERGEAPQRTDAAAAVPSSAGLIEQGALRKTGPGWSVDQPIPSWRVIPRRLSARKRSCKTQKLSQSPPAFTQYIYITLGILSQETSTEKSKLGRKGAPKDEPTTKPSEE